MTFRHLNDEDRAEIWDLHGQGFLATEIHKKTGRSCATVTALIKRHGGIRLTSPTTSGSACANSCWRSRSGGVRTWMTCGGWSMRCSTSPSPGASGGCSR
jgi:IS30 family transposase